MRRHRSGRTPSSPLRAVVPAAVLAAAVLATSGEAAAAPPGMPPQRADYLDPLSGWQSEAATTPCPLPDTPGLTQFKNLIERNYGFNLNLGTAVCKGTSGHSVGRAWDWGVDVDKPTGAWGNEVLFGWLFATDEYGFAEAMARRLGLYYAIWNDRIYRSQNNFSAEPYANYKTCSSGDRTCRHLDHIHFSLSVDGGARRTTGYTEFFFGPDGASWSPTEQGFFYRGADNAVKERFFTGTWSDEVSFGGFATSGVSATSWGPGRVDIFTRGTDRLLYHKAWDRATGWVPADVFESLGAPPGGLASGPDASSWSSLDGNRHIDVFVRGADNALWVRTYNSLACPCGWSGWQRLGGLLTAEPGAVSWGPGRVDVFARAGDNTLWQKTFTAGWGWSDWVPLGGTVRGGPDAASPGPGTLWVFARGMNDRLYERYYASGRWSDWIDLGAPPGGVTSDPTALSRNGDAYIYVRSGDGTVWQLAWSQVTGWSGWTRIGGVTY